MSSSSKQLQPQLRALRLDGIPGLAFHRGFFLKRNILIIIYVVVKILISKFASTWTHGVILLVSIII